MKTLSKELKHISLSWDSSVLRISGHDRLVNGSINISRGYLYSTLVFIIRILRSKK